MPGEGVGDLAGRAGLPLDAERQCFQALQQHPGVERRQGRPGLAQEGVDVLLDEGLRRQDDAAEAAPLPVDMLGRRIHDAIGPELERLLPDRAREDVVDDERRPGLLGDGGDGGDVDDLQGRVGRALEEEDLGLRPDRRPPGGEIGAVHERGGDAEARQQLGDDVAARAEQGAGRDHVVARPQLPHQRGGHGRHAAGGGTRRFGAFEGGDAALEHGHGRIGEARVDEAFALPLEARLAFLGARIDVPLRQEQGLGGLAELGAEPSLMHKPGLGMQGALVHWVGHETSWSKGLTCHRATAATTRSTTSTFTLCEFDIFDKKI